MKKLSLAVALLLLATMLLSACKAPEPTTDEPSAPPPPSASPTWTPPPADPTVTPRPMEGQIEMPQPGATAQLIDPIDKATRVPFAYTDYVSQELGITFKIPTGWSVSSVEGNSNALVFTEPMEEAMDEFPTTVTISVSSYDTAQTKNTASAELDNILTLLRAEYPNQVETSSKADDPRLLGSPGVYVTYWINLPVEGSTSSFRTRGRILVSAVDKKLYQIRYLCPANYNTDYEDIFKKIRSSMEEL